MSDILSAALDKHQIKWKTKPVLYRLDITDMGDEVYDAHEMSVALAAGCTHFVLDLGRIDASILDGTPFRTPNAWFDLIFHEAKWLSIPRLDPEDLPHELYIREDGGRVDEQKMDERVQKLNETILSIMKLVLGEVNLSSQGPVP